MDDSHDGRISEAERTFGVDEMDDLDRQTQGRRSLLEPAPQEEHKTLMHQLQAACLEAADEQRIPVHSRDDAIKFDDLLGAQNVKDQEALRNHQARLSYGKELLNQIEADARRHKACPLTSKPQSENPVIDVGCTAPKASGIPPIRRGQSTLELKIEGSRARRAYGEELRRQAEADQQRRKSEALTAKPSWLDPAGEKNHGPALHQVDRGKVDIERVVTKNDRHAEMMGRRAYGEELRQQAEADRQRRQEQPFADNPCWLDPSPAGIKNPRSRRASFFDVDQVNARGSVGQSTIEIRHADTVEKLAYGKELLRQADDDRRRRLASSLTCKLGYTCKAVGMMEHDALADVPQIQEALQRFVDGSDEWNAKNPAVVEHQKPDIELGKVGFAPQGSPADFISQAVVDRRARQAYGAELLQQAAVDRKRRQSKAFTHKPNYDPPHPRSFASVAIAMGLAH